eukprot:CAMPEP_0116098390 /NCGR_PEP_ID=MMETSP0327-20121206/11198_1 /TAXON_ID=44447 /ORGANISM="Pseudo-nitzschia delicatissima, Strain B596" /LENGTH=319 /DNA_ID=CAMNT_0003590175 /DNA_START=73 /DNA_END=1032 /DNA_ORIENTATION=-
MRFFMNHSVFAMYTLTTLMFAHGKVREADALTHKPNVLKPSPTSGGTNAWSPNHRWNHRFAKSTTTVHRFTPRQQEQSQRSMEMRMAHGNIGIDKPKNIPSVPLLVASALTLALVFKTKTILALFQTPGWFFANMLYKPYQNALVSNPLVTKVLTGATLALTGDAAAQATSKMGYDKRRAISFAMFDSCYRVFQHNCFPLIIKLGQGNFIGKILPAFFLPAAAAIEQTLMYQFVIVPILYYPIFFTFTGSIQGLSLQQSVDRMKRQFLPCWKKNLMFWIPTQMVLFGLVAEKWQIPFACLMGTLWSMLLSNFAGDSKKK